MSDVDLPVVRFSLQSTTDGQPQSHTVKDPGRAPPTSQSADEIGVEGIIAGEIQTILIEKARPRASHRRCQSLIRSLGSSKPGFDRQKKMSHSSLKQEYVRLRMELAQNPNSARRGEVEARCRRILWILGRRYDWPSVSKQNDLSGR